MAEALTLSSFVSEDYYRHGVSGTVFESITEETPIHTIIIIIIHMDEINYCP